MEPATATDLPAADWLTGSALPWERLVALGPEGLPAYARVRQLPDPTRPGMAEGDAWLDPALPSEAEQTWAVLEVLGRHSSTPDDCFACVWDGYGDALHGPTVVVPHRAYGLFRGPLDTLRDGTTGQAMRLAFVWPADRAWCFAFDVDPHWMGVGASAAAVAELLTHPWLDVVEADPAVLPMHYGGSSGASAPEGSRMPLRYEESSCSPPPDR